MRSVKMQYSRYGRYNTQEVSTEWFSNAIDDLETEIKMKIEQETRR